MYEKVAYILKFEVNMTPENNLKIFHEVYMDLMWLSSKVIIRTVETCNLFQTEKVLDE